MTGVAASGEPRLRTRSALRRWSGWRALVRLLGALAIASGAAAVVTQAAMDRHLRALRREPLPAVSPVDVVSQFHNAAPIRVSVSLGWRKTPYVTTVDDVLTDVRLWRRMRFDDWDVVANPTRDRALDAMLARYQDLLASPARWDAMTPQDWDLVPQPMRALAFIHMAQYWSGFYQVGAEFDLPRRAVASTLAAIVMTESWFEHRAVHVNEWGNRDLGLAQASDRARAVMERLAASGEVDVQFTDADYFDPWKATRFLAIWFGRLVQEGQGDLDLAIRAYHRGMPSARAGEGDVYLARVKQVRRRFIRNESATPAWTFLWYRDRDRIAEAWPWLGERPGVAFPFVPPWDRQRLRQSAF